MKIHVDTPSEDVQVQIIPLIDVIFCILVFFILASLQLTRQQTVNVALPKTGTPGAPTADSGQSAGRPVVYIDASGLTSLDGRPIDRARLRQTLQEYYLKNPTGVLLLYADKNAFYENVLQVFAVMQEVGGDWAALATDPGAAAGTNPTANPTVNPTLTPLPLYGTPNPYSTSNPGQLTPLPGQNYSPNTNPGGYPGTLPNSYPGSYPGSGNQTPSTGNR